MRSRSLLTQTILKSKQRDNFCCLLANVDDENEILHSVYDLNYVIRLLAGRSTKNHRYGSDFSNE